MIRTYLKLAGSNNEFFEGANIDDFIITAVTSGSNIFLGTSNTTNFIKISPGTTTIANNLEIVGNILPSNDVQSDIGSFSKRFKDLYLSANTIYLGDGAISFSNNSIYMTNSNNEPVTSFIPDGTITNEHIVSIDTSKITTGILPVERGGTGTITSTGTGSTVLNSNTTLEGITTVDKVRTTSDLQFVNTSNIELVRITESGFMGINTSNPAKTLDVQGDVIISGTLLANGIKVDRVDYELVFTEASQAFQVGFSNSILETLATQPYVNNAISDLLANSIGSGSNVLSSNAIFLGTTTIENLVANNIIGAIDASNITSGIIPIIRGGTGTTTSTGTGSIVLNSNANLQGTTTAEIINAITFIGDGKFISNITTSNITAGTLPVIRGGTGTTTSTGSGSTVLSSNATLTGTTTVDTLSATTLIGNGAAITNIDISNITNGILPVISGGTGTTTSTGTGSTVLNSNATLEGTTTADVLAATTFIGDGQNITNITTSNITIGTLPVIRGGTGTTTSTGTGSTVLNSNATLEGTTTADVLAATTFIGDGASVTNITTSNITSGTLPVIRGGTGTTTSTGTGSTVLNSNANLTGTTTTDILIATSLIGDGASVTNITTSNITSGTLPVIRGGTGTTTSTGTGSTVLNSNSMLQGTTTADILSATTLMGDGQNITNITTSNITTGTLPVLRGGTGATTSTGTGSTVLSSNATLTGTTTVETLAATTIMGNGALITDIDISNITTGILPVISGGTGTTTSTGTGSTVLSSNATLQGTTTTDILIAATLIGDGQNITSINTSNITIGTLPVIHGGTGTTTSTGTGSTVLNSNSTLEGTTIADVMQANTFIGDGASITNITTSNITTGTLPVIRGGTGTTTSTGTGSTVLSSNATLTGTTTTQSILANTINVNGDVLFNSSSNVVRGIANQTTILGQTIFMCDHDQQNNPNAARLFMAVGGAFGEKGRTVWISAMKNQTSTAAGIAGNEDACVPLHFRSSEVSMYAWNTDITMTSRNANIVLNANNVGISTSNPTEKLHVVGNALITGTITGSGPNITDLSISNITTGVLPVTQGGTGTTTSTGTGSTVLSSNANLEGTTTVDILTANTFIGDGSNITNITTSNITTGTLPVIRGGTGTTTSTGTGSNVLNSNAVLEGTTTADTLVAATLIGDGANVTNLTISHIGSGILPVIHGGTGTTTSTGTGSTVLSSNATLTGTTTTENMTVEGDLVVNGTNFIANVQTVEIQDNILMVNKGQVGSGVSAGRAGLVVDRGDAVNYEIVFSESVQMFQAGAVGDLETLATQPYVNERLSRSSNFDDLTDIAAARSNIELGSNNDVIFESVTATTFIGNGAAITNITTSNITTGTLPVIRGGTGTTTSTGTGSTVLNSNANFQGTTTAQFLNATAFTGDGSNITNITTSNITTGILPVIRGGTGTSTSTGTGSTVLSSNAALTGTTTAQTFNATTITGNGAGITNITTTNITTGTLPVIRGGTGTTTSTGTGSTVRSSNATLQGTTIASNILISGDIIPSQPGNPGNIGSSTNRFASIWTDEMHISANTLYLGDTAVLGSDQSTIVFQGDTEHIHVITKGVAQTSLMSVAGINMNVSGSNANVLLQAVGPGGQTIVQANSMISLSAPICVINGQIVVNGSIAGLIDTSNITSGTLPVIRGGTGTTTSTGTGEVVLNNAPLLKNVVFEPSQWITTSEGNERLFFELAGSTYVKAATDLRFRVNNLRDDAMIFTNTANLGIGTVAPSEKLHVVGNIKASGTITAASFSGDGSQLTGIGGGGGGGGGMGFNWIFKDNNNSGNTIGLYHEIDQKFALIATRNNSTSIQFNNSTKLTTTVNGVTITGTANADNFSGSGTGITNINANNITTGILPVSSGGTGASNSTGTGSVVLNEDPTFEGIMTADTINAVALSGDGSNITNINAANITAGVMPISSGGTGTNNATGTGSVVLEHNSTLLGITTVDIINANTITGDGAGITNLNANNITSGAIPVSSGGTGTSNSTGTGAFVLNDSPTFLGITTFNTINALTIIGSGTDITDINAANITAGVLPIASGGTGSTTATGEGSVVLNENPTLAGITTVDVLIANELSGNASNITNIDADNISAGILSIGYGGTGTSNSTGTGSVVLQTNTTLTGVTTVESLYAETFYGDGSNITNLNASNITTGILQVEQGGTGTATSTGTGSVVLNSNAIFTGDLPIICRTNASNADDSRFIFHNGGQSTYITSARDATLSNDNPMIPVNSSNLKNMYITSKNLILNATGGSGNVGIGTDSPTEKLNVIGNIYASGDIIVLSDSRHKKDLLVIENALDRIDQLTGYTFAYANASNSERHAGVLAQDVQKVLPEAVHETNGSLAVAYGNLIALLIEGIKELRGCVMPP